MVKFLRVPMTRIVHTIPEDMLKGSSISSRIELSRLTSFRDSGLMRPF